jgi:hypothetical protein
MPTIITRGAASVQAFGLMSSGGTYGWMAQLTASSSFYVLAYATRVNSTGSYVIGTSFGGASYGSEYVVTINSTGTAISSNTTFQNSGSNLYNNVYDITLDSSDNIYSVGRRYQATPSCCCTFEFSYWDAVTKTDSASSNLGSSYFSGGTAGAGFFSSLDKFSDGTILMSGYYSLDQRPTILKLNSTLTTLSWGLKNENTSSIPVRTNIDGSNNVVGLLVNGNQLNIIKTNSSGTITYKKYLNGFGSYYWGSFAIGTVSKPTFDSSNNIYFTGHYFYQEPIGCCSFTYPPRSMALSVNSTGTTLSFAKGYVGDTAIQQPTAMVKDSSDNMYFANYYNGSSGQGVIIFKLNSSGVLQWARAIVQGSTGLTVGNGFTNLAIDGTNFVLAMSSSTIRKAYILKMPTDGSGSGSNFSMNSKTFSYVTPTDFSVVDLTGLSLITDAGSTWSSTDPTLTTTGIAPAVSTAYTIQNKKI